MRLLENSLMGRLQWEEGDSGCHWRDLVNSRVRERPVRFREAVKVGPRTTRDVEEELEIAWRRRTGKSEATLDRRIALLKDRDA